MRNPDFQNANLENQRSASDTIALAQVGHNRAKPTAVSASCRTVRRASPIQIGEQFSNHQNISLDLEIPVFLPILDKASLENSQASILSISCRTFGQAH